MHPRFAPIAILALSLTPLPITLQAQTPTLSPAVAKYVKVNAPAVLLTHVRIIDGTGAAPLEDQSILIENGKIASISKEAPANSSYVSFNASTGPTSTLVVPNGDYIYNTTFTLAAADAADVATLSLLADDTVSVYLNNVLIQQAAGPMGPGNTYAMCSDVGPNCTTPLTFSFTGLQAGLNQLRFDVKQVNGVSEGLDFSGSISPAAVPEPFSLALFGTGIFGLVGLSRRYLAAK